MCYCAVCMRVAVCVSWWYTHSSLPTFSSLLPPQHITQWTASPLKIAMVVGALWAIPIMALVALSLSLSQGSEFVAQEKVAKSAYTCSSVESLYCAPYLCDERVGLCWDECDTDDACVDGMMCDGHECVPDWGKCALLVLLLVCSRFGELTTLVSDVVHCGWACQHCHVAPQLAHTLSYAPTRT